MLKFFNVILQAVEIPGVRMCRVQGALHFANCDAFKMQLAEATGLDLA